MGEFVVRLHAPSGVRLSTKPYDTEEGRRNLFLALSYAHIAVFDQWRQLADGLSVPDGLTILVKLVVAKIDEALLTAAGVADHALSMMSCVAMGPIDAPRPIWAYDATPGVEQREYRHCVYEAMGPRLTRPFNDQHLLHLLDRNYKSFLSDATIKEDFKTRVQRSMMAFRRGLSDNDDLLNEFLTAWSSMEGLDCVYTKLLPAANVRHFKDGMKDVLNRLGQSQLFDKLERLRNDIAHGSLSLEEATKTVRTHIGLVRKALVLMILRILKADEATTNQIVNQTSYKGKFPPHARLQAKIGFDPVDIQNLEAQPHVKVWVEGAEFTKNPETLGYKPDIRFEPQNLKGMSAQGLEFWGDDGIPIRVNEVGVAVIPKATDTGAS